jgi:hypothetical protein
MASPDTQSGNQKAESVFDEATLLQWRKSLQQEVVQALQAHGLKKIDEGTSKTQVIESLARTSQKQRSDTEMWKKTALRVTALLTVALFANFGLVMWATDLNKDTAVQSKSLIVKDGDQHQIVEVATATKHLGLRYASVMDTEHLAQIDEVTYTLSMTRTKVVAKVAQVELFEDATASDPMPVAVFTLATGDRLRVDPVRLALIPGGDATEQGVMERVNTGLGSEEIAAELGVDADTIQSIAQKYVVCQGQTMRPTEDELAGGIDDRKMDLADGIDFDLRCNSLIVDDPALDVAVLEAKLAAYATGDPDDGLPEEDDEIASDTDGRQLSSRRRRRRRSDHSNYGCCSVAMGFIMQETGDMAACENLDPRNIRFNRKRRRRSRRRNKLSDECCYEHDECLNSVNGACVLGGGKCGCRGKCDKDAETCAKKDNVCEWWDCDCWTARDKVILGMKTTPNGCIVDGYG